MEHLALGELVRTLREAQGLTQDAVHKRGGPNRETVGKIEMEKDPAPSEATLQSLDESLALPSGFLHSIATCRQGPTSDWFDAAHSRAVTRGDGPLLLHCFSGEDVQWPSTLLVDNFDGLPHRITGTARSMLIDVDALPHGDAESGAGFRFVQTWTELNSEGIVRSTTLRAGIFDRGVLDVLAAVKSLQQARTLLDVVRNHHPAQATLGNVQFAALAALFVAYAGLAAEVSTFDVLDRIQGLGGGRAIGGNPMIRTRTEPESLDRSDRSDEELTALVNQKWHEFRTAVGLESDYSQHPNISTLYDYLGEALHQRREILNVSLPSGPAGLPTRSEIAVWPLDEVVRTTPCLLLYDGQRFGSLPALWEWSWEANIPRSPYWHVTTTDFARSHTHRDARLVCVGADIDALIRRRFADLAVGEAALSHRRSFDGGHLAVLTLAKSHGLESHPVFLPDATDVP